MKQWSVVIAVVLCFTLLTLPAFAGLPHKRAPVPAPSFSVSPGTLDYGDVNTGSNKVDSLIVSNGGTSTLSILYVSSSDPQFVVTPKNGTVSAGGTRKFTITFAPTSAGKKTSSIVFMHSDTTSSPDTVVVSGNGVGATLEPIFTVAPTSLDFGTVTTGMTKRDSVTVTNTGTLSLVISSVTSSNASFTVTPTSATIAVSASRKFFITYAPTLPVASDGFVRFNHNAANAKDSIRVTGTGTGDSIVPRFSVDPTSLDFGDVAPGSTKSDSVFVTNTGKATLSITRASSSNGVFTVTPGQATIPVGARRKFTITFAPTDSGRQNAFIRFTHNAAGGKDSIPVTGYGSGAPVKPVFTVAPASLDYGDVNPGGSKADSVFVTNTGTASLTVSQASSSNARFTVSPPFATIAAGAKRKFTITFAPNDTGRQNGFIRFTHNAAGGKDSIPVTGNGAGSFMRPYFSVAPETLDFGAINNGTTKRDSVIVTNTGLTTLTITTVTSDTSVFTVTPKNVSIAAKASRTFFITFAPLDDGPATGHIVFVHNAETQRDTVIVTGSGRGGSTAPLFTATPPQLDFGSVTNGQTASDSVMVTNTGTADLTITNTSSSNSLFTVTPRTATIAPAASRQFTIAFAPLTAGLKTGVIRFTHNATPGSDSVRVSGTGIGPDAVPLFSASRAMMDFGTVDTGQAKTDSVIVSNPGITPLIVSNTTSTNARFRVTPRNATIPAGESASFTVTFTPLALGRQDGAVIFTHNAASTPDTVLLTGTGGTAAQVPLFSVKPASLDFGYVERPATRRDSVVVTNLGNVQLVISDVSSDNDQFSVAPSTAAIEASASQTFIVTFAPVSSNAAEGQIVFAHNAATVADTVAVKGNMVRPVPIMTARADSNGTEVMVDGIVTRCKGSYARIQDISGGITIRQSSGAFRDAITSGTVRMGDVLRVRGRLSETNALKQIAQSNIMTFEVLSRDNPLPDGVAMTLAEIAAGGEAYESCLIRVTAITITGSADTSYVAGRSYAIRDASDTTGAVVLRIPSAADSDIDGTPALLMWPKNFLGVLSQSSTTNPAAGYQLAPVLPTDLLSIVNAVERPATAAGYTLEGNSPNPFTSATTIGFVVQQAGRVAVEVYSSLGRRVATLGDGVFSAGRHQLSWDGRDALGARLPAGVYFCRLTASAASPVALTRTMILMQ